MLYDVNVVSNSAEQLAANVKGSFVHGQDQSDRNFQLLAHTFSSDPENCTLPVVQYLNNILIYVP